MRIKHLLSIKALSSAKIEQYINLATQLKKNKALGNEKRHLRGKNIVLLFEKDSTRTRCSFEVAATDQGAHVTYIGSNGSQMGKKESIKDTARVLGRIYDGIEYRGFDQSTVETLAKYAGVPVWNGLTDQTHPTQALADLLTIKEHSTKENQDIKVCFIGQADNNVAMSLMFACAKSGIHYCAVAPGKYHPDPTVVEHLAKETGSKITITESIEKGVKNADFLYTDVWVSMGEPTEIWDERIKLLLPYQVNSQMMKMTGNKNCKFMHCLPAFHNLETELGRKIHEKYGISEIEVTDEVFESDRSIVFDQAENRLHTIKAVIVTSLQ